MVKKTLEDRPGNDGFECLPGIERVRRAEAVKTDSLDEMDTHAFIEEELTAIKLLIIRLDLKIDRFISKSNIIRR